MERQFNEQDMVFEFRQSRRVKHPQIRLSKTGKIIVTTPLILPSEYAYGFLLENIAWVEKQYASFKASQNPLYDSATPKIIDLHCLNERWQVSYASKQSKIEVSMMYAAQRQSKEFMANSKNNIKERLNDWLKNKAKRYLAEVANQISKETGLSANKFSVRNQKTRWGSCSATGNISLNRNLLFLPYDSVRYLIIHELCHTRHMNHSHKFWDLVQKFEPNYKKIDKNLNAAAKHIPTWAQPD